MRWIGRAPSRVALCLLAVGVLVLVLVPAGARAQSTVGSPTTVAGTVVNSSGSSIAGAEVTVYPDGDPLPPFLTATGPTTLGTGTANAQGQFSVMIPGGDEVGTISASAPGYASGGTDEGNSSDTTVVLSDAAFSGTVTDRASGYDLAGTQADLYDLTTGASAGDALTDADGYYGIAASDVNPADSYVIEFPSSNGGLPGYDEAGQPDGTTSLGAATVLTPSSADQGGLDIAESLYPTEVAGVVTNGSGPVSGANVGLTNLSHAPSLLDVSTLTSSSGTYVLDTAGEPGDLLEAIPPLGSGDVTTYEGNTEDPSSAVTVTDGQQIGANILMDTSGTVTGNLEDVGQPQSHVGVELEGCAGDYPAVTNGAGDFTVTGVNPGTYSLFSVGSGLTQLARSGIGSTSVSSGGTGTIDTNVPETGAISGDVRVGPGSGQPGVRHTSVAVEVFNPAGDIVAQTTGTAGRYTITGIPAGGRYVVEFVETSGALLRGEFYGDARSLAAAKRVTVKGEDAQNVNGDLRGAFTGTIGTAGVLLETPTPLISGIARVGHRLTVDARDWTCQSNLSYQWLVNGFVINRATGRSYTVPARDGGDAISVQVNGYAPGYLLTSTPSIATVIARRY